MQTTTLPQPTHQQVRFINGKLFEISQKYHDGIPLTEISNLLNGNGCTSEFLDGIYCGRSGSSHNRVSEKNWLSLTWYKMEQSGRFEITAYVS